MANPEKTANVAATTRLSHEIIVDSNVHSETTTAEEAADTQDKRRKHRITQCLDASSRYHSWLSRPLQC
jgi:hypothetical protein